MTSPKCNGKTLPWKNGKNCCRPFSDGLLVGWKSQHCLKKSLMSSKYWSYLSDINFNLVSKWNAAVADNGCTLMREKVKTCFSYLQHVPNVTNLPSEEPPFNTYEQAESLTARASKHVTECEWNDDATEGKNRPSLCLRWTDYPGSTFEISGKIVWEDETTVWRQIHVSSRDSVLSNSGKQWITKTTLKAEQPRTSSQYCYKNNTFLEITLNSSVVSH